mgnify:CR=1 FL=1
MEPPEKIHDNCIFSIPYIDFIGKTDYHLAPEIFVSEGTSDSIVGKWVNERGGVGGIHHLAYEVDDVEKTQKEWLERGYVEFSSEKPFECDDLTQIFTKPSELFGVTIELIKRKKHGFCKDNVKKLMESTLDKNV